MPQSNIDYFFCSSHGWTSRVFPSWSALTAEDNQANVLRGMRRQLDPGFSLFSSSCLRLNTCCTMTSMKTNVNCQLVYCISDQFLRYISLKCLIEIFKSYLKYYFIS